MFGLPEVCVFKFCFVYYIFCCIHGQQVVHDLTLCSQSPFFLSVVILYGVQKICKSRFCSVLHILLEQPHGNTFMDSTWRPCRFEVAQEGEHRDQIRRPRNSRPHLYIHTLGRLCSFSQNIAFPFPGSFHLTVVFVSRTPAKWVFTSLRF